ncbi:MAG: hypothetical protein M3P06_04685 [Acidobacteriota bacterium]|nr:hypothetical protein [Acidobacteriota bacterium]
MTRAVRQTLLVSISVMSLLLLLLFFVNFDLTHDPKPPTDFDELAKWIADHPADWMAISAMTDRSLDSPLPLQQRVALWRSGHRLATYLAPLRTNPTAGFVRAGLFHWYELGAAERKEVLAAAAPLLREPANFSALHRPLWELTRDLGYLRRSAPKTTNALWMLSNLAIASGDFAEYRELRAVQHDARMNDFRVRRASGTVAELIHILPRPIAGSDEPLVRAILEEIDRRPFDLSTMGGRVEELALFAIRHNVRPLTALAPLVDRVGTLSNPTRARLALALGDRNAAMRVELSTAVNSASEWIPYHLERAAFEQRNGNPSLAALYRTRATVAEGPVANVWTNACGRSELCTSVFRVHDGPFQFRLSVAQSDEIPPYVEVYVDDVLVTEGEVRDEKTFSVDAAPGIHQTEVRLVNRAMRNGAQRRVRLS